MSKDKKEPQYVLSARISELPRSIFPRRELVYDDILEETSVKPTGYYEVQVKGKKYMSVYVALLKRLKANPDLASKIKLHLRGSKVYIERVSY